MLTKDLPHPTTPFLSLHFSYLASLVHLKLLTASPRSFGVLSPLPAAILGLLSLCLPADVAVPLISSGQPHPIHIRTSHTHAATSHSAGPGAASLQTAIPTPPPPPTDTRTSQTQHSKMETRSALLHAPAPSPIQWEIWETHRTPQSACLVLHDQVLLVMPQTSQSRPPNNPASWPLQQSPASLHCAPSRTGWGLYTRPSKSHNAVNS